MYPTVFSTAGAKAFAEAIDAERARQLAKFGDQKHPDIDPRDIDVVTHHYYGEMAARWKAVNSERAAATPAGGRCSGRPEGAHAHTAWDGILLEEVYEALAESDRDRLRAELLQVAAVCAAWIWDLDNRPGIGVSAVAPEIVAYRDDCRPSVLLCREHGHGWAGMTALTPEDLPDGGICTWGRPGPNECGRDVLTAGVRDAARQATGQPAAEACHPVEVDGNTVLVRGTGDWNEQGQHFMAEVVRAAKRQYETEPKCPNCGHLWAHHGEEVCGVRSRHQGKAYNCGCTDAQSDHAAAVGGQDSTHPATGAAPARTDQELFDALAAKVRETEERERAKHRTAVLREAADKVEGLLVETPEYGRFVAEFLRGMAAGAES